MEVILLQNMVIRQKRFSAGATVVVDEVIGRYLIEQNLAYEVPVIESEPVAVKSKPRAAKKVAK